MDCFVSSINYCPVKSLSYQSINSCNIKKDLGMINDRIFAFSRGVELDKAKLIGKFLSTTERDEISEPLNEQLVVELYSK